MIEHLLPKRIFIEILLPEAGVNKTKIGRLAKQKSDGKQTELRNLV